MTEDDDDLLLAEYVLGTLGKAARLELERRIAREPDVRAMLLKWERRLASAADVPEAEPVADRVWQGIESAIEHAHREGPDARPGGTVDFLTIRADQGAWEPLMEGVEKKPLYQDPSQGVETYLIRIAPGTSLPEHGHDTIEECLVLDGDVILAGQHLRAGDFQAAFPGLVHHGVRSEGGCLLYVRSEIR